jgi:hypothetical protein
VKTIQKLALCLALTLVLSAPLTGCGDTWQGVKQDWNDVTSSNDDAAEQPAVSTADASQPATVTTTTTATTATTTAQATTAAGPTDGWTINP